jgi:hypothetical protein
VIWPDPDSKILICIDTILAESIGPKEDRAQFLLKILSPILILRDKLLQIHFANLKSKGGAAVEGASENGNRESLRFV